MATLQLTGTSAITAVDGAVATIMATPSPPPIPAVPSLPADISRARADAYTWPGGIRAQVIGHTNAVAAMAAGFVSTTAPHLHELAAQARGGDQSAAGAFIALLRGAQQAVVGQQAQGGAVDQAVTTFRGRMAANAATFAADSTAAANAIGADQQQMATLRQQIADLQSRIERDRYLELLGWLAGPLGYLAAREIGSLIDDEAGMLRQVDELNRQVSTTAAEAVVLQALVGSLGRSIAAGDQVLTALVALGNGLAVLGGEIANVLSGIDATSLSHDTFVDAEVDTVTANCRDVSNQATTLLGGVTS